MSRWTDRGGKWARSVIASERLYPEDSGAGAVFAFLDFGSVDFHLVANLNAGGVALKGVGFSFAGAQLETACGGHHASCHKVMAAADLDGDDNRDGNHRADTDRGPHEFAIRRTDGLIGAGSVATCGR